MGRVYSAAPGASVRLDVLRFLKPVWICPGRYLPPPTQFQPFFWLIPHVMSNPLLQNNDAARLGPRMLTVLPGACLRCIWSRMLSQWLPEQ